MGNPGGYLKPQIQERRKPTASKKGAARVKRTLGAGERDLNPGAEVLHKRTFCCERFFRRLPIIKKGARR